MLTVNKEVVFCILRPIYTNCAAQVRNSMYVLSVYINYCKGGLVLCYNLLIFPLYRGDQFYWWRKPEYPEKNTYISQITENYIT